MSITKTEILNYVEELTQTLDFNNLRDFTSNSISEFMAISRSHASKYLNELNREGVLIKIISRPVIFIERKTLEEKFHVHVRECSFLGIDDLMETIQEEAKIKKNYETLVGYDTFLKQPINQIKAALKFPGIGLPVIIHGNAGVGKTRLVREIFSYGKECGLFKEDAKFYEFKVTKDTNAIELLIGTKAIKGVLESVNDGIVLIRNCQNMSLENQQQLGRIVEKGYYIDVKSQRKMEVKCHVFLSIDGNYKALLDGDLAQCFPVICELPDFNLLDQEDKITFVIQILQNKAMKLKKKIFISRNALHLLITQKYYRNIDDLHNILTDVCALLNANTVEEKLIIDATELPLNFIRNVSIEDNILLHDEYHHLIHVSSYKPLNKNEKVLDILTNLVEAISKDGIHNEYPSSHDKQLFTELISCFHVYLESDSISEVEILSTNVQQAISSLIKSHGYTLPYVSYNMISYFLIHTKDQSSTFLTWEQRYHSKIEILIQHYQYNYPTVHLLVEKILKLLELTLDFRGDNLLRILILLNLNMYNSFDSTSSFLCFIVAHGDSTATSMANAVNTLLGTSVFEALDLSLNLSTIDIVEKMKRIITQYMIKTDILILVDMGSLEGMNDLLADIPNKNIGVINNVSTKLALEVGYMVKDDCSIEKILQTSMEHVKSSYTLHKNTCKKNLVIFVSDNGINMANRMKQLFANSLPNNMQLEIESFTVDNVLNEEFMSGINNEYNLLFISGMTNRITNPMYISLENILSADNIDHLLARLNQDEIQILLDNLLHNFSLENIIANLSILDGSILFKYVESAVNDLQRELNVKFSRNNLVGLYIHLCCMVERLVTKESIKNKEGLDEFRLHQRNFISIAQKCMKKTCSHYGIEIEMVEIAYLYDFVREDIAD